MLEHISDLGKTILVSSFKTEPEFEFKLKFLQFFKPEIALILLFEALKMMKVILFETKIRLLLQLPRVNALFYSSPV